MRGGGCWTCSRGRGSLEFECLSRGAASAVFVDKRPDAVKLISGKFEALRPDGPGPRCGRGLHGVFEVRPGKI
ncbi:MAG: RsmD family RNA methyltransferase [Oscillospiraceae bacterium]